MADTPPTIVVEEGAPLAASDVLSLVRIVTELVNASERRIIAAMKDNADAAKDRWTKHDTEHAKVMEKMVALEATVASHAILAERFLPLEVDVKAFLRQEEHEDLVRDIRVRPFKTLGSRLIAHWRDILLFVIAVLALLGISSEAVGRLAGG